MAAMKPRTGDGPLEVSAEGRGIVMRIPSEGGGRLVIELNEQEAAHRPHPRGAPISLFEFTRRNRLPCPPACL